ncbi:hypothetical protein HY631_03605 [Candidatus Uhrbacteria bacterium]|nr:hypothetical protein [Candidatus Uhrbacteria bacterium]
MSFLILLLLSCSPRHELPAEPPVIGFSELLRQDPQGFVNVVALRREHAGMAQSLTDAQRTQLADACMAFSQEPLDTKGCWVIAACQWEAPQEALDCACHLCLTSLDGGSELAGCLRRAASADITTSCP